MKKYLVTGICFKFGPESDYRRTDVISAESYLEAKDKYKQRFGEPYGIDKSVSLRVKSRTEDSRILTNAKQKY